MREAPAEAGASLLIEATDVGYASTWKGSVANVTVFFPSK